jgi:peptidoglycan/LPS O-acetylase OafA/YrhL
MLAEIGSAPAPRQGSERVIAKPRIDALDMTKGVLVLLMVLYHTLNYSTDYTRGFAYLPFLPLSFILITGFLIGHLYLRSGFTVRPGSSMRSLLRGLRLVAIFTVLNLLAQVVGRHKPSGPAGEIGISFFDYWFEIYVLGDPIAAFEVLLPIAYLLMLVPVLLLLAQASRWIPLIVALAALTASILMERWDEACGNLTLLSAGFLGVMIGSLGGPILRLGRYWPIAIAAYGAYALALRSTVQTVAMQLVGALLAVAAIFSMCAALGTHGFTRRRVVALGKYSLLSYIFQIAFLQILSRVIGRHAPWRAVFFLQMIAVVVAMMCFVELTNWLRRQNRSFAVVYNVVLG